MIKLIKSSFYNEKETKKKLVEFIEQTDIFSMSKWCRQFEEDFAAKQQRKHAVLVNSGSSANLVLIQALLNLGRLKRGDKVGFSALTWPTNIMPLLQLGLVPVAIDCELETLNVSPKTLEPHIANLQGLFLTNVLGFSDDIAQIRELCQKHNVLLLEDNCESLGSRVSGTLLGNYSLASTFSFFVGHHLSTIEGGMLCTDDQQLYYELVKVRAHGWDRSLPAEEQTRLREKHEITKFYAYYTFYDLGLNVRSTEINGFLGTIAVGHWDEIVSKRAANFKRLHAAAQKNPDFYPLTVDHMDLISNFAMPIITKSPELFEKYRQKFEKAEVEVRPVIAGDMTRQPFYMKYSKESAPCPNSRLIHEQGFYFGNNPELDESELTLLEQLLQP